MADLATLILDRVQDWHFASGQRIWEVIAHDVNEIVDQYIKERNQQEAETLAHALHVQEADFDTLLDKLQDGEGSLRERVRRLEEETVRLRDEVKVSSEASHSYYPYDPPGHSGMH